jgi:hypothetical protein
LNGLKALYDSDGNLHYVKYKDVSTVVDRVYSETGVYENITDVILVFLGMDETRNNEAVAVWAVDVTPQGPFETEYTKLVQGKLIVPVNRMLMIYIVILQGLRRKDLNLHLHFLVHL